VCPSVCGLLPEGGLKLLVRSLRLREINCGSHGSLPGSRKGGPPRRKHRARQRASARRAPLKIAQCRENHFKFLQFSISNPLTGNSNEIILNSISQKNNNPIRSLGRLQPQNIRSGRRHRVFETDSESGSGGEQLPHCARFTDCAVCHRCIGDR
jgi:hypothetical protein